MFLAEICFFPYFFTFGHACYTRHRRVRATLPVHYSFGLLFPVGSTILSPIYPRCRRVPIQHLAIFLSCQLLGRQATLYVDGSELLCGFLRCSFFCIRNDFLNAELYMHSPIVGERTSKFLRRYFFMFVLGLDIRF